jgi:gamma-glutamylputrescine oxidase
MTGPGKLVLPMAAVGRAEAVYGVDSVWADTAAPLQAFPQCQGELVADVVIVGGGFTGLSSAHFLAKAGLSCVVLEANQIGWGASGRTGGFVSPRFRVSFSSMMAAHGRQTAELMRSIGFEAIDNLEEIVAELALSCEFARYGVVVAAHNQGALQRLHGAAEWTRREFADQTTELLDRHEVGKLTGSSSFVGGTLIQSAAGIHPLNYVRGLARSLAARGVRLFEGSAAVEFRDQPKGVIVRTTAGTVRAKKAILGTNAYSGLTAFAPRLKYSVIPFQSAVIATARLDPELRASILPQGHLLSDARRVLRWARIVDNRLVFGGRGAHSGEAGESIYRRLARQMIEAFPQLHSVPVEFRWSGLVAMTTDQLPHVGRIGENIHFAVGFNGTGVSMANLMGKYLARTVLGQPVDLGLIQSPLPRIPFYSLRTPAVRVATAWMQALDSFR